MKKWNFEEFRTLCEEKRIATSTVYQNSLNWRWKRADFHAEMAEKVWEELYKEIPVCFIDQRCYEAVFSYEAHVESCIFCLHALGDILAQIINVALLEKKYSEESASMIRIVKTMEKEKIATIAAMSIKKMLKDEIYQYITAFCNTIKHRRILKSEFCAEYGGESRNESGIKFESLTYKNHRYPETWGSDILNQYRNHILALITGIGNNINRYVKKL